MCVCARPGAGAAAAAATGVVAAEAVSRCVCVCVRGLVSLLLPRLSPFHAAKLFIDVVATLVVAAAAFAVSAAA